MELLKDKQMTAKENLSAIFAEIKAKAKEQEDSQILFTVRHYISGNEILEDIQNLANILHDRVVMYENDMISGTENDHNESAYSLTIASIQTLLTCLAVCQRDKNSYIESLIEERLN